MKSEMWRQRLSSISTAWSVLRQAHTDRPEVAAAAQRLLLEQYGGAVHRYLLATLRDPAAADDLTQEFALCLVHGEFRGANPQRGRFRDYVKAVLFHLVSKYRRAQQKQPGMLPPDSPALAALASPPEDLDREFNESWRQELFGRTWQALARANSSLHAVLHARTVHPKMPSAQMAKQLSQQLDEPMTAANYRQKLSRARALFAEFLVDEVAQSLENPTPQNLEEELRELDLLVYCQPILNQRYGGSADD